LVGESGEVTLAAEKCSEGVCLRISGLTGVAESASIPKEEWGAPALLDCLETRLRGESDGTALLLEVPHPEHLLHGRSA
jgi:hypothetical protein